MRTTPVDDATDVFRTVSVYVVTWSCTPRSSSPSGEGSALVTSSAERLVTPLFAVADSYGKVFRALYENNPTM